MQEEIQPKYSNRPYTPEQMEYFRQQISTTNYFAERVKRNLENIKEYRNKLIELGEPIVKHNLPNTKYFLMEDGTIFKSIPDDLEFYRLNLDIYQWESDPTLITVFFDNMLKFEELHDFEDIFKERSKNHQK